MPSRDASCDIKVWNSQINTIPIFRLTEDANLSLPKRNTENGQRTCALSRSKARRIRYSNALPGSHPGVSPAVIALHSFSRPFQLSFLIRDSYSSPVGMRGSILSIEEHPHFQHRTSPY